MRPSARRAAWTARRRRIGRTTPAPVAVIAGNCMSVSTSREHAEAICAAYLTQADKRGAAVVGLTECNKFRVAAAVARHNKNHGTRWRAIQFGNLGEPESGSALIIDDAKVNTAGEHLIDGTAVGEGVRARFMVTARCAFGAGTEARWSIPVTAGHAPPSWAPVGRRAFVNLIRIRRGVRLGDMNYARAVLARLLPGATVRAKGVIAAIVPAWVPCSDATAIGEHLLADADHAGVLVVLWPTKKEQP